MEPSTRAILQARAESSQGAQDFFLLLSPCPASLAVAGSEKTRFPRTRLSQLAPGFTSQRPPATTLHHPGSPPSEKLGGQWKGGGCAVKYGGSGLVPPSRAMPRVWQRRNLRGGDHCCSRTRRGVRPVTLNMLCSKLKQSLRLP